MTEHAITGITSFITMIVIIALLIGLDYYSWCRKKRNQKRCANGAHQYSGWRHLETTHYGDKDLYQRKCHHCGVLDATVSRLEP